MAIETNQGLSAESIRGKKPAGPFGLNAEKAGNIAMAGLFLLFIFTFAIAQLVLPDRQFSAQENRYLTAKPAFTWQRLRSAQYMSQIETYLTDQFPGRDNWVSFKALAQHMSNQKENNQVYFAADGYLIGKPQAVNPDIFEKNLQSVKGLEEAGYQVALLVSPMAGQVLRDNLPAWAYGPEQAEMLAQLDRKAPELFVNAEPYLDQAAAAGRQVFFRTDHHWTMAGAYQAYLAYMEWLGEPAVPMTALKEEVVSDNFYGTLWSKNSLPGIKPDSISVFQPLDPGVTSAGAGDSLTPEVTYFDGSKTWQTDSLYQAEFLQKKDQYAYFLGQNQALVVIRRQGAEEGNGQGAAAEAKSAVAGAKPGAGADRGAGEAGVGAKAEAGSAGRKLLIFKDSYAHAFVPFLLPHFDEIHLADLRYWKQDPIAYLKEQGIHQVLFLYNADDFAGDRSISQVGAYLARHK